MHGSVEIDITALSRSNLFEFLKHLLSAYIERVVEDDFCRRSNFRLVSKRLLPCVGDLQTRVQRILKVTEFLSQPEQRSNVAFRQLSLHRLFILVLRLFVL